MQKIFGAAALVLVIVATSPPLLARQTPAEERSGRVNGLFSGRLFVHKPFSADAMTVVIKRLPDGSSVRMAATAHLFRDSAGRVRVDYEIPNLDAYRQTTGTAGKVAMAILLLNDDRDGAGHLPIYSLDTLRRTYRAMDGAFAAILFNASAQFSIPVGMTTTGTPQFAAFTTPDVFADHGGRKETLPTTSVEGLEVSGTRVTGVVPRACMVCDGFPGSQSDERWVSEELGLVVIAKHIDRGLGVIPFTYPGKGIDIDYRLTNVHRDEPPSHLFTIPAGYSRQVGNLLNPDMSFRD